MSGQVDSGKVDSGNQSYVVTHGSNPVIATIFCCNIRNLKHTKHLIIQK